MEKLEELQKDIRSKLPRLMEVKEGCVIHHPFYDEHLICLGKTTLDRLVFNRYDIHKHEYDSNVIDVLNTGLIEMINENRLIVLGHPILLSDVLEWLNRFGVKRITYEGSKYEDCFRIHDSEKGGLPVNWDLSKPYLQDQNKKMIDYLHNLIKK